ncbi:MAG TPA: RagB/SusD family nutrient uptake outer membrane protein [Parasegetibacter sp.]
MKNTIKFICTAFICTSLLAGCSKWLDVQPVDQISDEKLFADADGFRNAINGLYQQMSSGSLYGRELTWGINSVLAQDYTAANLTTPLARVANYDFTSNAALISQISSTWSTAYNTIANANKIIHAIQDKDASFFPLGSAERNLILGEAMAVRGLLHFEMLRLFAPAPVDDPNGKYIPYQDAYPTLVSVPIATSEVISKVVSDLETAAVLVAEHDTLSTNNRTVMSSKLQSLLTGSNTPKGGLFFNFRLHRMNYVAIHGFLARVHLYAGDRANAKKEAEYMYKEFGPAGRLKWWAFTPESQTSGPNKYHKLVNDVIMACYDPNFPSNLNTYRQNFYTFKLNTPVLNVLYPSGDRDNRLNLINRTTDISDKWLQSTSTSQYVPQQNFIMPVLRMSEMYYIYAECLFEEGNTTDALRVLNEMRYARGKVTTFSSTDRDDFYDELFNEIHKEYMEEGQTVFAHKRLKRDIVVGAQRIPIDNKFVLPIPDGEKIF